MKGWVDDIIKLAWHSTRRNSLNFPLINSVISTKEAKASSQALYFVSVTWHLLHLPVPPSEESTSWRPPPSLHQLPATAITIWTTPTTITIYPHHVKFFPPHIRSSCPQLHISYQPLSPPAAPSLALKYCCILLTLYLLINM